MGRQPRTQSGSPGKRLNCSVIASDSGNLSTAQIYPRVTVERLTKGVRRFASVSAGSERQRTTANDSERTPAIVDVRCCSLTFAGVRCLAELFAQLTEEFVEHLLRYRIHESRANRRNHPADVAFCLASKLAALTLGRDLDSRSPFQPAGSALPLDPKRERLRRGLLIDPDLANVAPFDPCHSALEMTIVAVFPCFFHLLASIDALLKDRRLNKRREDFLARSIECVCRRKLHPRLAASSRAPFVMTRARWARNSAEACMSESGSTPSAAFCAAAAIVVAESSNPRRDDSAPAAR